MMEIAFGPLVLACAAKSLAFGILFALLFPVLEARLGRSNPSSGMARRFGLGMMAAGVFGLTHLVVVCAADGVPPRIIQSTGLALVMLSTLGFAVLARAAPSARRSVRVRA